MYNVVSQKGKRTLFERLDASTRTEDCIQKFLANAAAAARHFSMCIFSRQETERAQSGKRAERGIRKLYAQDESTV